MFPVISMTERMEIGMASGPYIYIYIHVMNEMRSKIQQILHSKNPMNHSFLPLFNVIFLVDILLSSFRGHENWFGHHSYYTSGGDRKIGLQM
jgi:hypothetical protein